MIDIEKWIKENSWVTQENEFVVRVDALLEWIYKEWMNKLYS